MSDGQEHVNDVSVVLHQAEEPLIEESLVEEVSIDGMCGVY